MSTTKNAGRIGFVLKGAYDSSVQYKKLDVVGYNGSTYVAMKDTKGHLPTETSYWQKMTDNNAGSTRMNEGEVSVQSTSANVYKVTYDSGQIYTVTISGENMTVTKEG